MQKQKKNHLLFLTWFFKVSPQTLPHRISQMLLPFCGSLLTIDLNSLGFEHEAPHPFSGLCRILGMELNLDLRV